MIDFEIGAYDSELYYSEDYEGWLALRRNQLKLNPNDFNTKYRLAEALVITKRYEEALVFLKTAHDEDPEEEDFNQLILDGLRALGKKKADFDWKIIPETLALDRVTELKMEKSSMMQLSNESNSQYLSIQKGLYRSFVYLKNLLHRYIIILYRLSLF